MGATTLSVCESATELANGPVLLSATSKYAGAVTTISFVIACPATVKF